MSLLYFIIYILQLKPLLNTGYHFILVTVINSCHELSKLNMTWLLMEIIKISIISNSFNKDIFHLMMYLSYISLKSVFLQQVSYGSIPISNLLIVFSANIIFKIFHYLIIHFTLLYYSVIVKLNSLFQSFSFAMVVPNLRLSKNNSSIDSMGYIII